MFLALSCTTSLNSICRQFSRFLLPVHICFFCGLVTFLFPSTNPSPSGTLYLQSQRSCTGFHRLPIDHRLLQLSTIGLKSRMEKFRGACGWYTTTTSRQTLMVHTASYRKVCDIRVTFTHRQSGLSLKFTLSKQKEKRPSSHPPTDFCVKCFLIYIFLALFTTMQMLHATELGNTTRLVDFAFPAIVNAVKATAGGSETSPGSLKNQDGTYHIVGCDSPEYVAGASFSPLDLHRQLFLFWCIKTLRLSI